MLLVLRNLSFSNHQSIHKKFSFKFQKLLLLFSNRSFFANFLFVKILFYFEIKMNNILYLNRDLKTDFIFI